MYLDGLLPKTVEQLLPEISRVDQHDFKSEPENPKGT